MIMAEVSDQSNEKTLQRGSFFSSLTDALALPNFSLERYLGIENEAEVKAESINSTFKKASPLDDLKIDFEVLDPQMDNDDGDDFDSSEEEEDVEEEEEEEFVEEEEEFVEEEAVLESVVERVSTVVQAKVESEPKEQWTTEVHEVHFKIIREVGSDGTVTLKTIDAEGREQALDPFLNHLVKNEQRPW